MGCAQKRLTMHKRVLVCGGRDFTDRNFLFKKLDDYFYSVRDSSKDDEYGNWLPDATIIHGGARGVDLLADEYAVVNWCAVVVFDADWSQHGKSAGPIRNQKMLIEGRPDVVIAFRGGKGTSHMKTIARKAGIEVIEYE